MKITAKTPNITQYRIVAEPEDPMYHRCQWAVINLDHDTYTMTAETDCGNYTYGWVPTPKTESFVKLMARIDEGYLLGKIASESVFNFEESKRQLLEEAKSRDCTCRQIQAMEWIEDCGWELFFAKVQEILAWDYYETPMVMEYPPGAITFAKLFVEYLQPLLRKGDGDDAKEPYRLD